MKVAGSRQPAHTQLQKASFSSARRVHKLGAMNQLPPASAPPRLLIVPGLHDSGPTHWQSWLEAGMAPATRVRQHRWNEPDLARWSTRIDATLAHAGAGPWVAVAHSFGVLALVHHLARCPDSPVAAALLVAPADPARFFVAESVPAAPLPRTATMVASQNDPWLSITEARRWAQRWRCPLVDLGHAGHINAESGFRTFPFARHWVQTMRQRISARANLAAESAYATSDSFVPGGTSTA